MGKMNGGGVESVVMNYYRHIDRSRLQFDFLVDSDSTLVPCDEIESLGGRIIDIPPYQHAMDYQRELQGLFGQEEWKIVHSHINALSVFPLRAAKKSGVPVRIAHSHSSFGGGKGEGVKDMMKCILKTQALRYPTDLLACSNLAGKWLFGNNANFSVFPNAINLSKFKPNKVFRETKRRNLGISEDTFVVGHIGRMVPQKNHAFLLDVFSALLEKNPSSLLLLAGEGPLINDIKVKAADLGDRVRFLGRRNDVSELYQVFDAFCLPSVYEGLPVVGVECQASGVPILASSAVTAETAFTSLMEFEPLTSSPGEWAAHLIAMKGNVLSQKDVESLNKYDIVDAASRLTDFYFKSLER